MGFNSVFKGLNVELIPICHLLALFGAHPILHVSRVRVNSKVVTCHGNSQICCELDNDIRYVSVSQFASIHN